MLYIGSRVDALSKMCIPHGFTVEVECEVTKLWEDYFNLWYINIRPTNPARHRHSSASSYGDRARIVTGAFRDFGKEIAVTEMRKIYNGYLTKGRWSSNQAKRAGAGGRYTSSALER